MDDVGSMTTEELRSQLNGYRSKGDIATNLTIAGFALLFCSMLAVSVTLAGGFFGLTLLGACGGARWAKAAKLIENELERRPLPAPAEAAATLNSSGVAQDFNPAAAIVLENDMKAMSPLRLRKRNFSYG